MNPEPTVAEAGRVHAECCSSLEVSHRLPVQRLRQFLCQGLQRFGSWGLGPETSVSTVDPRCVTLTIGSLLQSSLRAREMNLRLWPVNLQILTGVGVGKHEKCEVERDRNWKRMGSRTCVIGVVDTRPKVTVKCVLAGLASHQPEKSDCRVPRGLDHTL